MKRIRSAVVLAAGYGKRLQPLTRQCAKPVIPFFNKPVLLHLLDRLSAAGIERVFVNLHYMGWSVRRALRHRVNREIGVHFSHEPRILGTAGVLGPLYRYLQSECFLMINGDIVTDIHFDNLIMQHVSDPEVMATVVLYPESCRNEFPRIGSSFSNRLSRFPYGPLCNGKADWTGTFAGIHVLNPEIYRFIRPNTFQCINSDIYPHILNSGYNIGVYRHEGYWNDIGNPERYFAAHQDIVSGKMPMADRTVFSGRSWMHSDCSIHPTAILEPHVFLYQGCKIERNTRLKHVIIWPGAVVAKGTVRENGIQLNNHSFYSFSGDRVS